MDNPAASLPPPGIATAPPEEWREALSTRLFQDESTIPAAASSVTANTAMVDVADVPLANSTNQVDHFPAFESHWDQLIADGTSPEVVAQIEADSDATVQLDTSQAMETFLSQVASDLPSQAFANSSSSAAIVTQASQVNLAADLYHSSEPVAFGPAGTSDLAQVKRLQVTAKPYPASTASPTKDEYKAENAVLHEVVTEMKGKLETVCTKSKQWVVEQQEKLKTAAERFKQETQDAGSLRIAKVQMSFQAQRQLDIQQQQQQHHQEMLNVKAKIEQEKKTEFDAIYGQATGIEGKRKCAAPERE